MNADGIPRRREFQRKKTENDGKIVSFFFQRKTTNRHRNSSNSPESRNGRFFLLLLLLLLLCVCVCVCGWKNKCETTHRQRCRITRRREAFRRAALQQKASSMLLLLLFLCFFCSIVGCKKKTNKRFGNGAGATDTSASLAGRRSTERWAPPTTRTN